MWKGQNFNLDFPQSKDGSLIPLGFAYHSVNSEKGGVARVQYTWEGLPIEGCGEMEALMENSHVCRVSLKSIFSK